jgi:hypothetical protein
MADSMFSARLFQQIMHLPRRVVRESLTYIQLVRLSLVNRFGQSSVIEAGGPVVSLTTFGRRSAKVYLAIESIASGSILPSRLILWIDDESLFNNPPATIQRLLKRGLEVRFCKNYGPHCKYYPYLESQQDFSAPLVTADDDTLYPSYWLERLIKANLEYPDAVNCYAAHVIPLNEHGFEKYQSWKLCNSTTPRFCHLAMGCMGVIYPAPFLIALKRAGTAFEHCCPKGDDLWLHVQALRASFRVRQILPRLPYFSFQTIPGSQQTALCNENVDGDGNDWQMRATYNEVDLQLLRADCGIVRLIVTSNSALRMNDPSQ